MPTATTYLKSHKRADKRTALQSLKDRFDYGLNPEKLGAVSSYLCDPATAHAEFMLVKNQYQGETDRRAGHGALCYQIRQAFPHGEVTAEEANRIGYETAMRWTKGKYQFFVCTHIDKEHIHNHIYYNSTAYDRSRKFRNFIGSSFALRRLSDRVCLEHDLSVIANPKFHSKGRYLHYGQWLGENQKLSQKEQIRFAIDAALTERPKDFADFLRRMETAGIQVKHGRGGVISFLVPGQQRAARFRAATLGDGYGPEDVQAVIDGKAPTRTAPGRRAPAPRRVNLLIDIQERMRQGKGPAYERWAKVYNLKQMAAALQYLKEHQLFEYDNLAAKTDAATERFHTLAGDIQHTEAELSRVSDLMAAVVQYAKTRPAFDGYKAAKYSRKYLAEHEAELADYRAAKATMAELLGGEKLPKMDVLKEKRRQLAARKKALYLEYRKAQQDMRELDLYSTVGTVISVCDSVNYILEEEELLQVFRLVNNYLYPGGVFIFDFNTVYKYREVIGNTTIAENREDCSFIWENYYDPEEEINEYDLTIFVQEEEDIFRRFTETHLQRGYTAEQMRALLEQAGLNVLEIMDSDTGEAATATSERVYIVAKEQQKELPAERYVK